MVLIFVDDNVEPEMGGAINYSSIISAYKPYLALIFSHKVTMFRVEAMV